MEEKKDLELLCRVLGSVASQMRGSMGNIHAALQQLEAEEPDGDGQREKSAAILHQSYYRMLRIMDNLSDAPLLSGIPGQAPEDEDIVAWLEGLVAQAEPLAAEQGLSLRFHSSRAHHRVAIQRELLERAVWNLLSNAMKFTPAGGRVDVSLDVRAGQVLLTVADTGCGIAPERMDTVFERYLHPERMDPLPHGLGLGLPLCRAIAEAHGGRFLLTSRTGEGTAATVALPDERVSSETVESPLFYADGGFQRALVGLSDALSYRAFTRRNLDA